MYNNDQCIRNSNSNYHTTTKIVAYLSLQFLTFLQRQRNNFKINIFTVGNNNHYHLKSKSDHIAYHKSF